MNNPTNGHAAVSPCKGCGKPHIEVECMVALPDNVNLCNACVDLCAEIVHERDGGAIQIAPTELNELRRRANEAGYAGIWLDQVRSAVASADAHLKAVTDQAAEQARRDFDCWYLNEYGCVADHGDKGVVLHFRVWCAARGVAYE